MTRKITDRLVASLKLGDEVRDSEVQGFEVRVFKSGATYRVRSQKKNRWGKMLAAVIGPASVFSATRAREEARQRLAEHLTVEPPKAPPEDALIIAKVWEQHDRWLKAEGKSAKTREAYASARKSLSSEILNKPLRDLSEDQNLMEAEFNRVKRKSGESAAARDGRYVRTLYLYALRMLDTTLPARHPCVKIASRIRVKGSEKEQPVMGLNDLPRWWAAVKKLEPLRREFHLFSLLSGLRRDDLYWMRWDQVDVAGGFLHVPEPKGGERKAFDLVLSGPMIDCLMKAKAEGDRWLEKNGVERSPFNWVWPGRSQRTLDEDGNIAREEGHITNVRTDVKRGVFCYLHGCRRSYASIAADLGVTEDVIARLLNHGGQGVTRTYIKSHAMGTILRDSQHRISAAIMAALAGDTPEKRDVDDYVASFSDTAAG